MISDNYQHKGLRRRLIATLKEKGIKNEQVLSAMGIVPRHVFFDEALLTHAYADKPFPIGEGQTISQPYTVAVQSALLGSIKGKRVLEIGTGSGYQACVLCEMGAKVFSIEYNAVLFRETKHMIHALGYQPLLFCGDGCAGKPSFAPYDAILITAAAPAVPPALIEQLAVGGRLVIPIGDRSIQRMVRLTKRADNSLQKERFATFSFVPLLGKEGWHE